MLKKAQKNMSKKRKMKKEEGNYEEEIPKIKTETK